MCFFFCPSGQLGDWGVQVSIELTTHYIELERKTHTLELFALEALLSLGLAIVWQFADVGVDGTGSSIHALLSHLLSLRGLCKLAAGLAVLEQTAAGILAALAFLLPFEGCRPSDVAQHQCINTTHFLEGASPLNLRLPPMTRWWSGSKRPSLTTLRNMSAALLTHQVVLHPAATASLKVLSTTVGRDKG